MMIVWQVTVSRVLIRRRRKGSPCSWVRSVWSVNGGDSRNRVDGDEVVWEPEIDVFWVAGVGEISPFVRRL